MDQMVHNCEIKQRTADDDGGLDGSNVVLEGKQVGEAPSHYSEDRKSTCEESKFTGLQESDMDQMVYNFEIKTRMADDDDGGDDVSNVVVAGEKVEEVPSHYTEDKSNCKENTFTDLQETGNSEVSSKYDACVEDETIVKDFQNLRDMDKENGINVEHILSCLKSLPCPFVWKPDKEVEIHPRGEVPINLAQHLAEKERGFTCMETDLFREVTIYLVLSYHKYITMLPKEGLLDIYHCYDILLKAEKGILNISMEEADKDTKRKETDISNVSTSVTQSMEENLKPPLANYEVLSVLCNSGNSSPDNRNDCENTLKTETIWSSDVTTSVDNSSTCYGSD